MCLHVYKLKLFLFWSKIFWIKNRIKSLDNFLVVKNFIIARRNADISKIHYQTKKQKKVLKILLISQLFGQSWLLINLKLKQLNEITKSNFVCLSCQIYHQFSLIRVDWKADRFIEIISSEKPWVTCVRICVNGLQCRDMEEW